MEKIKITNLIKIPTEGGDIFQCLKNSEKSYCGFGEAYFSNINFRKIKAWKRHLKMTCNIIVPRGKVKFVFYDEDCDTKSAIEIGEDNYCRITVLPKIWFGFEGLHHPSSLILNISDIPHSPNEIERKKIDAINFDWKTL